MKNYLANFIEEVKNAGHSSNDNPVLVFLRDKKTNSTRKLMIDTELYRARIIRGDDPINISRNYYGYDLYGSFINPNTGQIAPMRANRACQPRLYCADVNYLALIEVRPKIGNKISLATLKINDVLTILDLTLFHIPYGMDEEKQKLFADMSELFSTPVNQDDDRNDYLVTQEIADFVESLGYDGIAYSCSLSPALNQENYNCCNLVIFNYNKCAPIKSNVLEMIGKYDAEGSDYDYSDFKQIDDDSERLNLISYKEKTYDFNFPFRSKKKLASTSPLGLNKNIFVSTARQIYNIPVCVLLDKTQLTTHVGSSLTITIPRQNPIPTIQFTLSQSLNERINDLTLFFDIIIEEKLWFGDRENHRRGSFPMKISLDEYGQNLDELRQEFDHYKQLKQALLKINVNSNINMLDIVTKDRMKLDIIKNGIFNNITVRVVVGVNQNMIQVFDIQGHKIFLIFEDIGDGHYRVFDFFSKTLGFSWSFNEIIVIAPQYSMLTAIDFVSVENINFSSISSSYIELYSDSNPDLPLRANEDVWNLLLAYDISKDSRFLHLAEKINDWVMSTNYKRFKKNDYPYINKCQIKKRKGIFDDEDIEKITSFTSKRCNNDLLTMVYILLEDFDSAKIYFKKMNIKAQKRFIELPIAAFFPQIKEWI